MDSTPTEAVVRAWRAKVYGECTDENWEAVRENWMKPENIEWLKREVMRP